MAERRMFAKSIVNSDAFGDMPPSSRLLYFRYGMEADDDGFIINPKQIMRMSGASEDDIRILIAKHYIIPFVSGVIAITHWLVHNAIRKDRYKPTQCIEEKKMIRVNDKKEYFLAEGNETEGVSLWLPDGKPPSNHLEPQVSIGKERIDEERLDECKFMLGKETLSEEIYNTLVKKFGKTIVDEQIQRILSNPYYGCLNEKTISQWCEETRNRSLQTKKIRNSFNNFEQRNYTDEDFENIERMILTTSV